MSDPAIPEDYDHLYGDSLKNLELEVARLERENESPAIAPLDEDLKATVKEIGRKLAAARSAQPETAFRAAIGSLEQVDAKRFLVQNLLEAIKRGEAVGATLKKYHDLGLLERKVDAGAVAAVTPSGLGRQLLERKGLLKRVALAVQQIAANALRSVPKWVEIEPHVTLLPFPSLGFTLKGKGMSIHELYETLRAESQEGAFAN